MKVLIEINCENAAFDNEPEIEIMRILDTQIRKKINGVILFGDEIESGLLYDRNGNKVGQLKVIK